MRDSTDISFWVDWRGCGGCRRGGAKAVDWEMDASGRRRCLVDRFIVLVL
jgi:hypothetical protein